MLSDLTDSPSSYCVYQTVLSDLTDSLSPVYTSDLLSLQWVAWSGKGTSVKSWTWQQWTSAGPLLTRWTTCLRARITSSLEWPSPCVWVVYPFFIGFTAQGTCPPKCPHRSSPGYGLFSGRILGGEKCVCVLHFSLFISELFWLSVKVLVDWAVTTELSQMRIFRSGT